MTGQEKDEKIAFLEKKLHEIDEAILNAMGEKLIGGRALLSLSWARKLIARALGAPDD